MPKRRVKRHPVTQPSDPSYRLIPLTRNQNAIVDTEDFEWLNQWNWYALWDSRAESFYAGRATQPPEKKHSTVMMHRIITECPADKQIDHKFHDTLDNRKKNLRICEAIQNVRNQKKRDNISGFKGVRKLQKWWVARITANYNTIYLGCFNSPEEAAHAYDEAAKKYHGEFVVLNFRATSQIPT